MAKHELSTANITAALGTAAERSCQANPATAFAIGVTGVGILCVAAPGAVATPALAAAGFGTKGIVAGSAAASIHSGIGSVAAPGLFATLQSAGAGGSGTTIVYGTVQVIGGTFVSSAASAITRVKARI